MCVYIYIYIYIMLRVLPYTYTYIHTAKCSVSLAGNYVDVLMLKPLLESVTNQKLIGESKAEVSGYVFICV